jgi:hypothetical protein
MALFRCPADPRLKTFGIGTIPLPKEHLLRGRTDDIEEGHYMLYLRGTSSSIHPRTPALDMFF